MVATDLADAVLRAAESIPTWQETLDAIPGSHLQRVHADLDVWTLWCSNAVAASVDFPAERFLMVRCWLALVALPVWL